MLKIFCLSLFLASYFYSTEINCENKKQTQTRIKIEPSQYHNKQRRFDFYQKHRDAKILREFPQMFYYYELYEKLLKEMENEKKLKQNEEYEERKKIFVKFLLPLHSSSSFLSDFHTFRF
jgi:hypothetical protein